MFYEKTKCGYFLRVRLKPNSSLKKTGGITEDVKHEEYLKVSIISVPEKGKANKELLDFLSKMLDIPKSSIEIVKGQTDQWKKIFLATDQDLEKKFEEMACDSADH